MTWHAALREGAWVTPQRIRVYSILVLGALIASIAYLLLTAQGLNDYRHRPLGSDFSNVYAAGSYAREGQAALAFAPSTQFAREQKIFGPNTPFYGWHYPPVFLLLAAPLAHLDYRAAVGVWLLGTLLFYLYGLQQILPLPMLWLPALGCTAVWVNILNGNNGFLTAGLCAAGLGFLPWRPWLAGIFLGCLAYKPQYAVLLPLALLAGGYGRTFLSAALTMMLLVAASLWWFGNAPWAAFLANAEFTRHVVLEQGDTGFYKMQSLFAWLRYLGMSVPLAYAAQGVLALLILFCVLRQWARPMAYELKAAALILGTVLITPYSLDYDLMLFAPAIAFLVRHGMVHGFAPYEKTLLFFAGIVPIVARPVAQHTGVFLGTLVAMLLVLQVLLAPREYDRLPA